MPTNCVWLDNVAESVAERYLVRQFGRYGGCSHSVIDRAMGRALIYFENIEFAQYAVTEMKGRSLGSKKLQVSHFISYSILETEYLVNRLKKFL